MSGRGSSSSQIGRRPALSSAGSSDDERTPIMMQSNINPQAVQTTTEKTKKLRRLHRAVYIINYIALAVFYTLVLVLTVAIVMSVLPTGIIPYYAPFIILFVGEICIAYLCVLSVSNAVKSFSIVPLEDRVASKVTMASNESKVPLALFTFKLNLDIFGCLVLIFVSEVLLIFSLYDIFVPYACLLPLYLMFGAGLLISLFTK